MSFGGEMDSRLVVGKSSLKWGIPYIHWGLGSLVLGDTSSQGKEGVIPGDCSDLCFETDFLG